MNSVSRWCVGVLILFPLSSFSYAYTSTPSLLFEQDTCSALLKRRVLAPDTAELVKNFFAFDYFDGTDNRGFELRPKAHMFETRHFEEFRPRVVHVIDLPHPSTIFKSEIWQGSSERFRFLDVGFKHLREYSRAMNLLVADHVVHLPDTSLTVDVGTSFGSLLTRLYQYRWSFHRAVLEKYRKKKPYLQTADLRLLELINEISDNSDVFGLLKYDDGSDLRTLSVNEIQDRLLLTMQVHYFGDRSFFRPTVRGMMISLGKEIHDSYDRFPFEYRIPLSLAGTIRKNVYSRFNPKTTCELTRLAKFVQVLPYDVSASFLLRVLDRARSRGMETMLVSLDSRTMRLFRREYGIKELIPLPTDQNEVPEFLGYMDLRGTEFTTLYAELTKVALAHNAIIPEVVQWR
ncbi:MAG: hypothetical protein AB7G93_10260 [Bdellovibrionales bacterium]